MYVVNCAGLRIFAFVPGIGPVFGKVPNAPFGKREVKRLQQLAPKNGELEVRQPPGCGPCLPGSRTSLLPATEFFTRRLFFRASETASSNVSSGAPVSGGDAGCCCACNVAGACNGKHQEQQEKMLRFHFIGPQNDQLAIYEPGSADACQLKSWQVIENTRCSGSGYRPLLPVCGQMTSFAELHVGFKCLGCS